MTTFYEEVYEKHDPTPTGPHGWIQWKGTQPCIDLHCSCGYHGHMDADFFFYYYKCPKCKQGYALGQHIVLIPLTNEHIEMYKRDYKRQDGPNFESDELSEEDWT